MPLLRYPKALRARDLVACAMRAGWTILLFQTLAGVRECGDPESGNTNRGHPKGDRCLACRAPPARAADDEDLAAALEAVRAHRLLFWDALLVGFGATRPCAVPAN